MKKALLIASLLVLSTACQRNDDRDDRNPDNMNGETRTDRYSENMRGEMRDRNSENMRGEMRPDRFPENMRAEPRYGRQEGGCGGAPNNNYNNNPGMMNNGMNKNGERNENGPANAQEDDWTINERVRDALYNDPSMPPSARAVMTDTKNGVVTLTGNVPSKEEANMIVRKVKGVRGVRNVNIQLMVGQGYGQGQY